MDRIFNFGSLNIDMVYAVPHIVRPGETLSAPSRALHAGGKGLNQSVAAARAGARVLHAGNVGEDGAFLRALLQEAGADGSRLRAVPGPSGHAVIQVDDAGQNSILVCPGANAAYDRGYVRSVLDLAEPGDVVLTQNETNDVPFLLGEARARGLVTVLNPSPITKELLGWPLDLVRCFLVNETEGEALTGESAPEAILAAMGRRFPGAVTVLTLGAAGSMRYEDGGILRQAGYPASAVDTTAAGDTWTGYYLARRLAGDGPKDAMDLASLAAAIAVSRPGAAPSIPVLAEVEAARNRRTP